MRLVLMDINEITNKRWASDELLVHDANGTKKRNVSFCTVRHTFMELCLNL